MNPKTTLKRRLWITLGSLAGIVAIAAVLKSVAPDRSGDTPTADPTESARPLVATPTETPTLPTIGGAGIMAGSPIAREYGALDPTRNGWTSESVHNLIHAQMKELGALLEDPDALDADRLERLVSTSYTSGHLRPRTLETAFDAAAFTVQRAGATGITDQPVFHGVEGGMSALRDLAAPLRDMKQRRLDVKIFRIALEPELAVSRAFIVLSGRGSERSVQLNATWECRWQLAKQAQPRLLNVRVTDYEQVTVRTTQGAPFQDSTTAVFGGNACFHQQIVPGLDHWASRIEQGLGMYLDGWSGLAIGDVNNDGLDDLYLCQPGGLPNRLFIHQPDGSATEAAKEYGVDWLDRSTGALLVDLNNDGREDLVVAIQGGVLLMENNGDGGFKLRRSFPTTGQPYSLAAADFDNDGQLDIFVCCYNRGARAAQQGGLDVPVPYYDANNGAANVLLRNEGQFILSDVTTDVGMSINNQRFSYAAAWEDYDNDGDQDLYVANDFGRNNLYRNDQGRFTDVAAQAGVEDAGSGMSVAWADYNGDGWMDIYIGNMFSAAGSRITYQRQFSSAFNDATLASVRRFARGNTLFENAGDGTMRDMSVDAGVTMGRWAWSSNFVDINNDGREDLVVANGFVTGSTDVDL